MSPRVLPRRRRVRHSPAAAEEGTRASARRDAHRVDTALAPIPDVLISVAHAEAAGGSGRAMRDACRRGLLVRVRRGIYCPSGVWENLDARERHVLEIRAVSSRVEGPHLIAGSSAAALWGLPFAAGDGDDVTLLVPYPGGGSSEPGVRRTCLAAATAQEARVDGIPVTTCERTVLDHARALDFARAVSVIDHARSRRRATPVSAERLEAELAAAAYPRGAHALRRALAFSTDVSDSVGESEARARIHLLGFETPELQRVFLDDLGRIETDFYWPSVDVAGEFDGKVKYAREEYTHGDPAEVVWREKRREDRLRRMVSGVVRFSTSDVRSPVVLARLLSQAGIPRPGVARPKEPWPTRQTPARTPPRRRRTLYDPKLDG